MKNRGLITSPAVQQQIAAGNLSSAVLGAGRIAQLETQSKQLRVNSFIHLVIYTFSAHPVVLNLQVIFGITTTLTC